MFVIKRDGNREKVAFDKITTRINKLCYGLDMSRIDPVLIAQKVIAGLYANVKTTELDNLAAETAAYMTISHPDYAILAARIAISNLHKETKDKFSEVIEDLANYVNPQQAKALPLVTAELNELVKKHKDVLDAAIQHSNDYEYQFFGFKTLERSYLMKINGRTVERPQYMLMRVALGIHGDNIPAVLETYTLMSGRLFTHASPTLFHAGTPRPQLSSCFLIGMKDDSIEGIYDTLKTCALVSKSAGGIGLHVHNIRASGSYIGGTGGVSNGLVPMLRVFNNTARYVDQGGNKRPGAFAIYVEPWHADIFEFLDLKKNTGAEEARARDLFFALWISDLFMQRVEADADWSLFCPSEAPGLADCHGEEFNKLYTSYEAAGKARRTIKAQRLWYAILDAQVETGTPYILYKDACNAKSNQKNLGTIKSSNLCTEIIQYSDANEIAVCNLASLALPFFVKKDLVPKLEDVIDIEEETTEDGSPFIAVEADKSIPNPAFDFEKLHQVVKVVTKNLNKIIDINYYAVEEAKTSNLRHRPIGLGVQGLADAFALLRLPFDSAEAKLLNTHIFETIYHAALEASMETAAVDGPYSTYEGSPASQGLLQYDLWNVAPSCSLWNWESLKADIAKNGLRNSLLVAPMPTASTSQILGCNECFEPFTSNIYTRRVLSGEFQIVNPYMLRDLMALGLWNEGMRQRIIAAGGSIQHIPEIPNRLKACYRTVWEIPQRSILDMAADRGPFIDQSQSLNIHIAQPSSSKLTSMHFYGWKKGLKTGMYYLRTRPAVDAIKFTIDPNLAKENTDNSSTIPRSPLFKEKRVKVMSPEQLACSLENKDACMMCSG